MFEIKTIHEEPSATENVNEGFIHSLLTSYFAN